MTFDPSKLSPAPWAWEAEDGSMLMLGTALPEGSIGGVDLEHTVLAAWRCEACQKNDKMRCLWPDENHAAFIALARNAFDVMMRRGWNPICGPSNDIWRVMDGQGHVHSPGSEAWGDPFTALAEADKYLAEQEAKHV